MTSLRPLVIPAAAFVLAAGAPSANAHTRRPVYLPAPRAATPPRAASSVAERAVIPTRATPVRAAKLLPLAVRAAPGTAAVPGDRYPVAAASTGAAATGRPIPASARGPPL
jgi:hypothetical protein